MIRKKLHFNILCTIFILCISFFAQAQATFHKEIPDLPSKPALVNDLGNMLTPDEELLLEAKVLDFEKTSSNEIAIVTVDTLGGLDISAFAVELGRKWDIGKASKKNGVLFLASKKDRKVNISPAYGLSGVLPDVVCARIIRDYVIPNFKEGNIYAGFDQAVDQIILYSTGEFTADEKPADTGTSPIFILLFIMAILVLFSYLFRNKSGSTYVSRKGYRNNDDDWNSGGGFFGGGGGFGGGSSSSSGGGFGGFGGGGGGFDGGGASGSW